ncbi:winged helix-turn-helix transcriptional regulator [Sunxiuqinia sp. A32]|uniref:winged helix-turn-helix transcriptional regulator n=1 Tax=Sunxiuqinia sp. A32 TaxID=3461496 RepID=UPI004045AC3F
MKENIIEKFSNLQDCPIRNVLDRFGDKWSMLVLLLLNEEPVLRFNEIHKYIESISQKMLTVTLKSLEGDGLIKRTVYPQIPPKVEYNLTTRGKTLIPHLNELVKWAKTNMNDIEVSRRNFAINK